LEARQRLQAPEEWWYGPKLFHEHNERFRVEEGDEYHWSCLTPPTAQKTDSYEVGESESIPIALEFVELIRLGLIRRG
jgi:hypothetical protein